MLVYICKGTDSIKYEFCHTQDDKFNYIHVLSIIIKTSLTNKNNLI